MLHRTTLGRHALEALCPSRPNRVACNGCSVSHWDRQTSRGIKDLHMTGPRLGHQRGRGCSVEVPALAWAELVICSSCYMRCKPVQGKPAQLSRQFYAQAEWWRLCRKTTLRRCLGRAGRSLVWLALGPVRRQVRVSLANCSFVLAFCSFDCWVLAQDSTVCCREKRLNPRSENQGLAQGGARFL